MTGCSLARVRRIASRITPADLWVGLSTLVLAPMVELGLRVAGVRRTARLLGVRLVFEAPAGRAAASRSELPLDRAERRRLHLAWRILAVGPFDATCLRRSLIGAWHLRRRQPAVRIGVRKDTEGIKAHAWIEVGGVSLDPAAPGEFAARWETIGAAP